MLKDESFRRTAACGHYERLLRTSPSIASLPSIPIATLPSEAAGDLHGAIMAKSFNAPLIITGRAAALGLKLPPPSWTLTDVAGIVGPAHPVKLIEVGSQGEIAGHSLGEFAEYLARRTADHKVLNMISLEFSSTALTRSVVAPAFVRELDWIDVLWPIERRRRGDFPQVQKYCLAGMAGSYTDFHIDFGGTSVWYHVLAGRKRFYLVPPTTSNLAAFAKWSCSASQASVFFGDLVPGQCFVHELVPGQTFVIPSGWIHSVFTPADSLVFGGNFVHSFALLRQLQVYHIEAITKVGKIYRFPCFRQIHWYFLASLLAPAERRFTGAEEQSGTSLWQRQLVRSLGGAEGARDGGHDEEEEEGEAENDVEALCRHLPEPKLFNQLPVLVRTAELWLRDVEASPNQPLNAADRAVFAEAARAAGFSSPGDICAGWWRVLHALAAGLHRALSSDEQLLERYFSRRTLMSGGSQDGGEAAAAAGGDEVNLFAAHVWRLQHQDKIDLLSDEDTRDVLPSFERDICTMTAGAAGISASTSTSATEQASGLSLKISRPAAPPAAAPAAGGQDAEEVEEEAKAAAKPLPKLIFKFSEATAADPLRAPAREAAATAPAEPAPQKAKGAVLKFKVVAAREGGLNANNANVVAAKDLNSGGRYGTRGLKLSASFLRETMDADVVERQAVYDAKIEGGFGSDGEQDPNGDGDEDHGEHDEDDDSGGSDAYDDHDGAFGAPGRKRKAMAAAAVSTAGEEQEKKKPRAPEAHHQPPAPAAPQPARVVPAAPQRAAGAGAGAGQRPAFGPGSAISKLGGSGAAAKKAAPPSSRLALMKKLGMKF